MDDEMFSGIHSAHPGPKVSMLMPAGPPPQMMQHSYNQPSTYTTNNGPHQQMYAMGQGAPPVGSQHHPAEVTLGKLKTYFYYSMFALGLLAMLWLWWTFFRSKKETKYSGTALPGINGPIAKTIESALQNPYKQELLRHALPIVDRQSEPAVVRPAVTIKVPQPEEDIVHIYGSIPIWDDDMDEEEQTDVRISENNTDVNDLIKEREAFTKGLETSIAQNIKKQPPH
jgi:hypothetical protein